MTAKITIKTQNGKVTGLLSPKKHGDGYVITFPDGSFVVGRTFQYVVKLALRKVNGSEPVLIAG